MTSAVARLEQRMEIVSQDGNGIIGILWDLMTSGLTWSENGNL